MKSNVKKRTFALLCSLCLALSLPLTALAADTGETDTPPEPPSDAAGGPGGGQQGEMTSMPTVSFSDVSESDWFYEYVSQVASRGVMTGSNSYFYPNNVTTRAEFISYLYAAAGSPSVTAASASFTDVSSDASYCNAVIWAEENEIVTGTGSSLFSPDASLTRETAMTLLYRAAEALNLSLDDSDTSALSEFSDYATVDSWATEAMAALVSAGIITGNSDGTINPAGSLTNAQVAAILSRVLQSSMPTPPDGEAPDGAGGDFGGSGTVTNGTSANTISENATVTGTSYTSTGNDENALRVDGATVTLSGVTVAKTAGSSSNTEDGDFYGQNAAFLALNGAQVTITGSTVNSSVKNGNGIFSYGTGTVVTVSDSTITTTGDNSGGIQTTGGGTTYANDLTVSTSGNSSAAIRSDRGGGTVVVSGGTYNTAGTGSPAIYSTADITVDGATLSATNSEAVVVEGMNSVTLTNCDLTGNMTGTYQGDGTENIHNIMLYQSMSGDAAVGTSSFTMTGGSIIAEAGDMFYVTNTHSVIALSDVDLTLDNGNLLTVVGNSSSRGWGTAGKNGGQVEFTAADMTLTGDVTVDTISTLDFTLASGSTFQGTVNIVDNEADGTAVDDNAVITVSDGAVWTLTGNCTVTSLTNNGTINYNGYTITLADGTVLS